MATKSQSALQQDCFWRVGVVVRGGEQFPDSDKRLACYHDPPRPVLRPHF